MPAIATQNDDATAKNNVICGGTFTTTGLSNLSFHLAAGNATVTRIQVRKNYSSFLVNESYPSQSDYNIDISGSSSIEIFVRGNLPQQYSWISAQNIILS